MEKKRFPGRIFIRIVLLLLLAAVVLLAAFLLYLKSGMSKMELSPDVLSAVIPDPKREEEHLSFTEDGCMTIRLDRNDLMYYAKNAFTGELKAFVEAAIADTGISLNGIGVDLSENGLMLDVDGRWKNTRLADRLFADIEPGEAGAIYLLPRTVQIGNVRVDVARICRLLKMEEKDFLLIIDPELTFLEKITDISVKNGSLCFTGPMADDYLGLSGRTQEETDRMCLMQEGRALAAPVLSDYLAGKTDCYVTVLPELMESPSAFTDYLHQLMGIFPAEAEKGLRLKEKNGGLISRWLPGYNPDISSEFRKTEDNQYKIGVEFFDGIVNGITEAYISRDIRIKNGEFVYRHQPFTIRSFYGENLIVSFDNYNDYLALDEDAFLCLIADEHYQDERMPKLSGMLDSAGSVPKGTDIGARYQIGLVSKGHDGNAYLMCRTYADWTYTYHYLRLNAEEYEEMLSSDTVCIID